MRILYINDELATSDGSNYHANGILSNLQTILGTDNVRSYPQPRDGSSVSTSHKNLKLQKKHKNLLQLIRMFRKTILSYARSRQLCQELEQSSWTPTHILARTIMFDNTALLVARHFGAKLICEANAPMYHEHCVINGLPFQKAVEHWEKNLLQKSDSVYVVSDSCRDMICQHYNLDPSRFLTIPNGYMPSLYSYEDSRREQIRNQIRKQEAFPDKFVVTFIGSLKPWHGINQLCQVAHMLANQPHIHFLVIGDGSEREWVEKYCSSHNNMTYKGKLNLSDMSQYLLSADLGIMPYEKMDSFYFSPLKMFDMIGATLPFIGTDQGQIHQVCSKFLTNDFLIKDCTPEAVCKQILSIADNPAIHAQMKSSLKDAAPQMTWNQRTQSLISQIQ